MTEDRTWDRLHAGLVAYALSACALGVVSGGAAAFIYLGPLPFDLSMHQVRPVHESSAFGWVFLGGVAVVYSYLREKYGPFSRGVKLCFAAHLALWIAAGAGIVGTLLAGEFSGREYIGYHPAFSALILAGWLLFAVNWVRLTGFSLRGRPAYVHMWSVATILFVVAFLEGHLYLLEAVSSRPLRDFAFQWKSAGVLVGSFNLLAYGSAMYITERWRGDRGYSRSRTAFALFWVGLLNTFTNYGHHTYHLPQSAWIHWISFLVSMLEIAILTKVMLDLLVLRRSGSPGIGGEVVEGFLRSATLWTALMLLFAILISIPPVNAMIHGTHVVVAHSMGSMIGIDSMILWAAMAFFVRERARTPSLAAATRRVRRAILPLNVAVAVLLASLALFGVASGASRYAGPSAPDASSYLGVFPWILVAAGLVVEILVLWFVGLWILAVLRPVLRLPFRLARPDLSAR